MAITINGTGSITGLTAGGLPDGSITADDIASGAVTAAKLAAGAGGKILQAVQTVKSDVWSLTSTTAFADVTGLSVNITPSSASNKILVLVNVFISSAANSGCLFNLVRGSTNLFQGDDSGNAVSECTFAEYSTTSVQAFPWSGAYLDSPATTSQVTYKIQGGHPYSSSWVVYVNRFALEQGFSYEARTSSTITAIEVAA